MRGELTRPQMVVCDIDGTLFDRDEHLPDFAKDFAPTLAEKGIQFTVATGRSPAMAGHWLGQLGITAPYVVNNGATIAQNGKSLAEYSFKGALVKDALLAACRLGMSVVLCRPGMADTVLERTPWTEKKVWQYGIYNDVYMPAPEEWDSLDIQKVIVIDKEDNVDRVYDSLRNQQGLHIIYYGAGGFEIMPQNCDKAFGVRQLARLTGIPLGAMMAIGNDANDVAMLKECGLGVAVGNAYPAAVQAAGYVCSAPFAQGVREALEKFC